MFKPFVFKKKLYMFDTDVTGIAYHSKHLEWMEAARVEMLTEIYKPVTHFLDEDNLAFVPIHIDIKYKTPVRFEETLNIEVWVEELSKIKVVLGYKMTKEVDGKAALVSSATVELVSVFGDTKKPRKLPENLVTAIQKSDVFKATESLV